MTAQNEYNYEFRKQLNQVHRKRFNPARNCKHGQEIQLTEKWHICIPENASEYLFRVGQDLQDYFAVSLGIALLLKRGKYQPSAAAQPAIFIGTKEDFSTAGEQLTQSRSFSLSVQEDCIMLCGADERGAAQGCYYLEDVLNLRQAPFLEQQTLTKAPIFSPRMVHSGWGMDQFPDQHLNAIAHNGMDAILIFVKDVNITTTGFLDFNNTIERAAAFGLDVYFYSYIKSRRHPEDHDAVEYYEGTYGRLIRACPKVKGVIFVGESCEFPSHDERTKGRLRLDPVPPGQENDRRPSPGWWPCRDYPQWLNLVKSIMRKYSPALDVVFWTYNWGWAPTEDRLKLIENLPQDISLEVTFEMFENIEKGGIPTRCVDYTASFAGPGHYFRSEAEAAKARNIPLYAMANTGGLSWDIGVIPYQPIPFQWKARWDALLAAHRDWGLTGLMESHHFGWWPSFISELCKESYWTNGRPFQEHLEMVAERIFGDKGVSNAIAGWQLWSSAACDYVPTNEDQYGPFRIGPTYPLLFLNEDHKVPDVPYAHFGAHIVKTPYVSHAPAIVPGEIILLQSMARKMAEGSTLLREAQSHAPAVSRDEAAAIVRLGKFMGHCIQTVIHVKQWYLCNQVLQNEQSTKDEKLSASTQMLAIAQAERVNVEETIPLVARDSRLGWEPSMEYMTDPEHLRWKLQLLQETSQKTIPEYQQQLR